MGRRAAPARNETTIIEFDGLKFDRYFYNDPYLGPFRPAAAAWQT